MFQFISGNLALDFVNTVGDRLSPATRRDYFLSQRDLDEWIRRAGLSSARSRTLPLAQAIAFRETLYNIFKSNLESRSPRRHDLISFNRVLDRCNKAWKLDSQKRGFLWKWDAKQQVPYPLARLAESATELLLSPDLDSLRQCHDQRCGWLFLDRSQGKRRRWCSMKDCGNRAKARTFLRKRK